MNCLVERRHKGADKKLHAGAKPDEVKEEFKDILKGIEPKDIAEIEEELINEGVPSEEIHMDSLNLTKVGAK